MNPYQALPKVELHSHLDCSLSYTAVQQLLPGLARQDYLQDFVAPPRCDSLAHYLRCTRKSVQLLQTREALQVAVQDLFAQLAADHVIYTEIRFAPLLHLERGLSPEAVVETAAEACTRASQASGIMARLVLCTLRHFDAAQSLRTAELVRAFQAAGVAALDLAGDEAGFPLDAHAGAYRFAARCNLPRIAHAGEACGPPSVWETLERLQPSRIGHGIRSIEDPVLVEELRRGGIHLEICPQCNVQTSTVPSYAAHPVDRLYRRGVSLGINTDTRGITQVTLAEEYQHLAQVFGWGPPDFLACNLNALEAAFIPAGQKENLSRALRAGYPGPGAGETNQQEDM